MRIRFSVSVTCAGLPFGVRAESVQWRILSQGIPASELAVLEVSSQESCPIREYAQLFAESDSSSIRSFNSAGRFPPGRERFDGAPPLSHQHQDSLQIW